MPKRKRSFPTFLNLHFQAIFLAPFILFAVILLGIAVVQASKQFFYKNEIFPQGVRYVPDQILAVYKPGSSPDEMLAQGRLSERDRLIKSLQDIGVVSQERIFPGDNSSLQQYYLLSLKKGTDIPEFYKKLQVVSEIQTSTPNYILKIQDIQLSNPNDPQFPSQWDLEQIHMKEAWEKIHTNGRVTVAVIDTGVDYNHEDLQGVVTKGINVLNNSLDPLDDHGHGSHVAGIIGAVANNGKGISGVSWGAKILAIKACNKDGDCTTTDIVKAIKYAVDKGVKIINISIAGAGSCNGTYNDIIEYARKHNSLIVAAAGNGNNGDGVGVEVSTQIPAACDNVFAVGSLDSQGKRSPFSNFGQKVEITAPGGAGPCSLDSCIISTSNNNGYLLRAGTSMAAPHVSGVAALLLSYNSSFTPEKIKSCLVRSGDVIQVDKVIGPKLNAAKAISLCATQSLSTPTPTRTVSVSPYSIYGTVFIDQNSNGKFDKNEKKLTGAQVVLSGLKSDSVISNSSGNYIFSKLSPGLFTISLSYLGQSISLPSDVSLTNAVTSKKVDLAVSSNLIPSPSSTVQKTSSLECFPDPQCADSKSALQVCSFQCEYR